MKVIISFLWVLLLASCNNNGSGTGNADSGAAGRDVRDSTSNLLKDSTARVNPESTRVQPYQ
jgi:hypothetical protein